MKLRVSARWWCNTASAFFRKRYLCLTIEWAKTETWYSANLYTDILLHTKSHKYPYFAYRTEIGWWIFALAGAVALLIALLTVSTQAI